MVKSIDEIAKWAADPPMPKISGEIKPPKRAEDLLGNPKASAIQERIDQAAAQGTQRLPSEVATIITDWRDVRRFSLGDKVRLLLALRSASYWSGMVSFAKWVDDQRSHNEPLFTSIPQVGQQYAMALNRLGGPVNSLLAERALLEILSNRDHQDSETWGILGRVYKDRWLEDQNNDSLDACLDAYWNGVRCNPTEVYPAINLLVLLRISGRVDNLGGLIKYINELLFRRSSPEYFDLATRVEVYSVERRFNEARTSAQEAANRAGAPWELQTTADSLTLLRRVEQSGALDGVISVLLDKASSMQSTRSAA
jgi:hypothetical protein